MKRFLTIMLGVLLIAAITAPALAWEFAMTGEMEWRFRYFARQGSGDLFGSTSVNLGTGLPDQQALGLAGPVGVGAPGQNMQVFVQGFSAKNADARTNETRVWLYPEIRVNTAVRLRGEYWVTGTNLRGLYDGNGINGTTIPGNNWVTNLGYNGWFFNAEQMPGNSTTPSGQSIGVWEKFWATAQTPWGIVAFGRRPFAFGLGWSTLHEKDANTESIIIVAPYGPLTFIVGPSTVYGSPGDNFIENSTNIVGVTDPGNVQVLNPVVRAGGTDSGHLKDIHEAAAFTYRNGPVEGGIFFTYLKFGNTHFIPGPLAGPGAADNVNGGALQGAFYGGGTHATDGTPLNGGLDFVLFVNYFKYFNGRFFLNAEYDFEYGDVVRNGGREIPVWGDAWWLDFGGICGPAKLTLAGMYSSGPDRRGGLLDTTGSTGQGNTVGAGNHAGVFSYDRFSQYLVLGGRKQSLDPFAWLVGIYGGGNNSYDGRGYWTGQDLMAYAARLDYAVAANLNVFGSYMYMNRASNTGTRIAQFAGGNLRNPASLATTSVPNVPDNYLGWEANVGVNWKLLEGLTLNTQFAYWQPGDWFKWAYVDTGAITPITVGGGLQTTFFVTPGRGIDPLIGWQGSLVVDF